MLMYARMTTAHAHPDHFNEAVATVQQTFHPAAQRQRGYCGFLLLTDRSSQELIGISLWETEADEQDSGGPTGYYQQEMTAFQELLTASPTTTTYEVVVQDA
jgi:quinol monooxygenase YgiN